MRKFEIGDIVICKNAPEYFEIKKGEKYVVEKIGIHGCIKPYEVEQYYLSKRFKKAKKKITLYEILKSIRVRAKKEYEERIKQKGETWK